MIFSDEAQKAVYEVIARRRDIRHFLPGRPLDDALLARLLEAAHQAPSVGFSQPWDFIVVRDPAARARIRESFLRVRAAEAARFPEGERRERYLAYKLEGIVESALNLCVTVDLRAADEPVLGTTAQPEALRWSACSTVQNLWLAARAEGVGVGWVSIVEPTVLRRELGLPAGIEPVAYLCLGYPVEFRERPLLEETGWRRRRPLASAVHRERFQSRSIEPPLDSAAPLAGSDDRDRVAALPPGHTIPPFDLASEAAASAHQLRLCKPHGALGRLETLATWYAGARGRFPVAPPSSSALFVFAADHGVVEEGVSAYPSTVTPLMVMNFLAGGAAVNVMARGAGIDLTVVDVGVAGDLSGLPEERERRARFVAAKVRAGTANLCQAPAMSRGEAKAALAVGYAQAGQAVEGGAELLLTGEMGIGNTTAAAALVAALLGKSAAETSGRGTGVDDATLRRKVEVVARALDRHRPDLADPLGLLAALGGLEIAAMAGLMLGGARRRVPVVVDGYIAGAAALVAVALDRRARDYLLLSHRSAERGARLVEEALDKQPLFDLGLRLGEGTGAVLAAEWLRHAVRLQHQMALLSTAGVVDRVAT